MFDGEALQVKYYGIMGRYQEEGIGVKGFTSDRGSIPKGTPRPRGHSPRGFPEDAPEVMRKSETAGWFSVQLQIIKLNIFSLFGPVGFRYKDSVDLVAHKWLNKSGSNLGSNILMAPCFPSSV